MGLGLEAFNAGSMDVSKSKSKGRKNIHNDDDEDNAEATGCWIKFRFFGSCISSRANVDSSISGSSSQYETCVFGQLSPGPGHCDPFVKRHPFSRSYGDILPSSRD
ncbi:probable receptor kinase At5g15080 [Olea europaea subsp. europaea]|uniref:Probable receptor kinase At5g15080 n=1 Tax=Olea europaea subsp. europaea TaxID=158383 RepID=A0A8S0U7V4_OLEEU|nr:probable receptor kinase At5g15080 [Olea europaea subsp. europaea]